MKFTFHAEADDFKEFWEEMRRAADKIIEIETQTVMQHMDAPAVSPARCQPGRTVDVWKEAEKAAAPEEAQAAAVPEEKPQAKKRKPRTKIDQCIVKAMLKTGLSQSRIAKELGVTPSAISQIVRTNGWENLGNEKRV